MNLLRDVLRLNRRRYANDVAVIDGKGQMTYAELIDRSTALARGLIGVGVRRGDHVGVLCGNGRFSAETYLGIVLAGAVAVPYNWRWALPELVFGINDSAAPVVLVESEWRERFEEAHATGELDLVERVYVEGPQYEALLSPGPRPHVEAAWDDGNVILYTGGTTGFSKGVVLSHRATMANAINMIVDTHMTRGDNTLVITPMFHSASLLCWFLPHVVLGARTTFLRGFDEEEVPRAIRAHGVTNGFLVPNMVRRLLAAGALEDFDRDVYRRMYIGGAALKLPDKLGVREVMPDVWISYQYGLTEAGPIVTRLRGDDVFREDVDGSIGKEFLLTEVGILDDAGGPVAAGESGNLCVRGPNVMSGYFNRPDATALALRDGWLHTGDLASRDDEGFIFFRDRAKDMIKTGGENVYSAEVEQVLYEHPAIQEVAIVGVPSMEWDEEVRAVVTLRPGLSASEAELRDYCRSQLAGYKIPKRIVFIEPHEMPINPSGKVLKTELRKRPIWDDIPASAE